MTFSFCPLDLEQCIRNDLFLQVGEVAMSSRALVDATQERMLRALRFATSNHLCDPGRTGICLTKQLAVALSRVAAVVAMLSFQISVGAIK